MVLAPSIPLNLTSTTVSPRSGTRSERGTDDILTLPIPQEMCIELLSRKGPLLGEEGDRVGLPRALWGMGEGPTNKQERQQLGVMWVSGNAWEPQEGRACMAAGGGGKEGMGASSGGRTSTSASVIDRTDAGQG